MAATVASASAISQGGALRRPRLRRDHAGGGGRDRRRAV